MKLLRKNSTIYEMVRDDDNYPIYRIKKRNFDEYRVYRDGKHLTTHASLAECKAVLRGRMMVWTEFFSRSAVGRKFETHTQSTEYMAVVREHYKKYLEDMKKKN